MDKKTSLPNWTILAWSLTLAGLLTVFLLLMPRPALADGPDVKTFGYNYVRAQELRNEVFIPYVTRNHSGWTSTLVIANTEPIPTDLTIDIFSGNGLFTKSIDIPLPSHGVYFLDLTNDDDLIDGRYQAHIGSIPAKIAAEVHTESLYMAMSYTDIGATGSDLIIPIVEKKANNWNTTVYVHNIEIFSGRLTITYFADSNPNPVLTIPDVPIAPLQSLEFETLAESELPDGFIGYAQITSNRIIGAVVARKNYVQESAMIYPAAHPFGYSIGEADKATQEFATIYPTVYSFVDNHVDSLAPPGFSLYIPLVAKQDSNWGSSVLQTQHGAPYLADISYEFWDNNGGLVYVIPFSALPGTAYRHKLDDIDFLEPGFRGSVVVSSNEAVWTMVGQEKQEAGDLFGYLTDAEVDLELYIPYVSKAETASDWDTKISIQDASASTNPVRVTLYNTTGISYTTTLYVPSSASYVLELSGLASLPYGFEGQAIITSLSSLSLSAVVIGNKPQPGGNHARVIKGGLPRQNATVFHDGQRQGSTDSEGLLSLGDLTIGHPLTVVDPVREVTTTREAHDDWAFRIHTTNVVVNNDGSITPAYTVTKPGRQILTTSVENTLVLFNIVVSIEWDADDVYMQTIADAFRQASAYLYDVTDGQMAFGQVAIYDQAQYWADADYQFSTKNTVRPYAFVGGLTSTDEAHAIRVGRFWDGGSGNQGNWNQPDGYRTLIHEVGHYALYLYDEYFIRQVDDNGNFIREEPAACTSDSVRENSSDATNASIMFYQYNASELAGMDRWTEDCQNTEQQRVNGEADWQTVLAHYGGAGWTLNTPTSRGSVMAGPDEFPAHLLPLPEVVIHNGGATGGTARQLTVLDPQSQPVHNALVALYTSRDSVTIAIDQGLTDGRGKIAVYGAASGDTIRAATFDGAYAGAIAVGSETSYQMTLSQVGGGGLSAQDAGQVPYLSMTPQSDGDGLYLQVAGLEADSPALDAIVVPGEGGGSPQWAALVYSPIEEAHVGTVSLSGVGLGTGQVRVSGGSLPTSINSDYNLQWVDAGELNDLYSEDGNFQLHLPPDSLPADEAYATVLPTGYVPGPLPGGKEVMGSAYDVRLSGAMTDLEKAGVMNLHYHPGVMGVYTNTAIYHWSAADQEWQEVGGEPSEVDNALSTTVTKLGIYALMGELVGLLDDHSIYLPIILRQ